ncbi:uncharacterized protein LOC143298367 [Babylonia areolata]|uniref:uncharacterized protein LOC143298367 n=1 Tax=Babylonia areolata TaxID=304850 RepID=UPI003FD1DB75
MEGEVPDVSELTRANYTDNQKMLQTSVGPEPGSSGQQHSGWQDEVETLTPSPVIRQPPQPTTSPPMARRRFHNFTRDSWDGGGGSGGGGEMVGQGRGGSQTYQPSKYGLVVEEMYGHEGYEYQHPGYEAPSGYRYATAAPTMSSESVGGQSRSGSSPSMKRRVGGRAPAEHRRSYPDNSHAQQMLEEYYDGYGSSSTAGGSTSGYGSGGGGYDYPGNMRSPPVRKSADFIDSVSAAKPPRSILRNSHSQGQLHTGGRDRQVSSASPPMYPPAHQEALQSQGNLKKTVGDLRQWQQQHQEELINQHIETQALYEKQVAPLETLVRQLGGGKDEDPSRWEPIRRAADNIIREKNMIIEKLRQRVLELEEDLKMADNKLRHALLATDDKADLVHQKVKELQYKNSNLKTELAETLTKKNGEINSLEEQLGATEHEVQQLKTQLKMKEADFSTLENKLLGKEKEVEEWGQRFQEMKTNHQQLRHKLDSVERYLADLPTAEETMKNTQEILRLKEEHAQSRFRAEDLEKKLTQTRKQLTARDLRLKEAEQQGEEAEQRAQDLERELQRLRREDESAQTLFRTEHELGQTRQEKERLVIDLEKAKKLLETTHRRLRQTEMRLQSEMTELRERLGQEEEVVGTLRQEVIDKEQQVEKSKRLVKELGGQNQDLMEQNLILREQMTQFEQHATDDGMRLQRRFMAELGLCFSELQSLVQVCLQRARGEDPNMSVLLGVRDAVGGEEEEEKMGSKAAGGRVPGEEKGQTMKQWLSKLGELRGEVDSLRASLCNQYAEDMGQNIQCATQ